MTHRQRIVVAFGTVAIGILASGCHSHEDHYTNWAIPPTEYVPRPDGTNAFDSYALAALDAEKQSGSYMGRVSFFPDQRVDIIKKTAESVKAVAEATKKTCQFEFVPHKPFQPAKYQSGWRMIGRVFEWSIQEECLKGDFDGAIKNAVTGTTFGFDLVGGGATDASLGLSIADNVRKAIAPYLDKMSAKQLDRLARGIKDALARKPSIVEPIKHERSDMMQAVQYVQDCVKKNEIKQLSSDMGPDINEAVKYLGQIRESESKRSAFFNLLESAGEAEFADVEKDTQLPAAKREKFKQDFPKEWKKLPKQLFGSARPLLEIDDATVARTRMLILHAEMLKFAAQKKPYPESLDVFTRELTIDPYSGAPFLYHADAAEFKLYSVGANCRDDGGDTDETFTTPDLRLECPPN